MAISRTYGCAECGATWKTLHMNKSDPADPCPNGCGKRPTPELTAPALNLGAPDRGIQIPQGQGARERLAADIALKGTGMGDVNSHMKAGDIAAKPVAVPEIPKGLEALRGQLTPRFMDYGKGMGDASKDPYRSRNMGLLGQMKNSPPVANISTRYMPTKKGG